MFAAMTFCRFGFPGSLRDKIVRRGATKTTFSWRIATRSPGTTLIFVWHSRVTPGCSSLATIQPPGLTPITRESASNLSSLDAFFFFLAFTTRISSTR